jgi:hypothetical protein
VSLCSPPAEAGRFAGGCIFSPHDTPQHRLDSRISTITLHNCHAEARNVTPGRERAWYWHGMMGREHANMCLYCSAYDVSLTPQHFSRAHVNADGLCLLPSVSLVATHARDACSHSIRASSMAMQVSNCHGALCSGYLHNAARKRSMMHSSICAMETRNLLDSNKVTTCLRLTTPLLAGRSTRA